MDRLDTPVTLLKTAADYDIDFSRLLAVVYQDLYSQIALADSKAQLVMGATAVVLVALVTDMGRISGLARSGNGWGWVGVSLIIGTLVLLFAAIVYAIRATIPKVAPMTDATNLLFFGHIALLDQHDYEQRFLNLSAADFKAAYLAQIHARSRIVRQKFAQVRLALICLSGAFLLWLLAQLILALM